MSDTPKKEIRETESKAVKKADAKKDSFFAKVKKFFREHYLELKKISWPTFREVVKNTMITLAAVFIVGVIIWLFDWGVSALRDNVLLRQGAETPTTSISDALTEQEMADLLARLQAANSGSDVTTSAADAQ